MTSYSGIYEFNDLGLNAFKRIFEGSLDEAALDPMDRHYASRVAGTGTLTAEPAHSSKELAQRVLTALGPDWSSMLSRPGIWAWLTFVLRDLVLPQNAQGSRTPGELHRWYPSDAGDWQKGQRHLIRMPVQLLGTLGNTADHLLCGPPSTLPEIREQLTSQQDMFHPEFQKAARILYFDEQKEGLKRGAGGKSGGSARRLAKVRQQLDVTWDLFDLDAARIVQMLPKEFDKFKPKH